MTSEELSEIEDTLGQLVQLTVQAFSNARRAGFWEQVDEPSARLVLDECRRLIHEFAHVQTAVERRGLTLATGGVLDLVQ
jgi:hypothetical protein